MIEITRDIPKIYERVAVEEFYKQVDSGKRTKEELKTMAENVLFEIKNGPPFVYS